MIKSKAAGAVLFFLAILVVYNTVQCTTSDADLTVEERYTSYCGSCHLLPAINNIPKKIWKEHVLPEMAARMGIVGYAPERMSMEEELYVKRSKAYSETPMMDSLQWVKLRDYIIAEAPDTVLNSPNRIDRSAQLKQFTNATETSPFRSLTGNIVNLSFDDPSNQFFLSGVDGRLYDIEGDSVSSIPFNSPVVSSIIHKGATYVTEIGTLNPSEVPEGNIYKVENGRKTIVYERLHRPVFTRVVDLNEDGVDEILVCEFGYLAGSLSLLTENTTGYDKRSLLSFPGPIKFEIEDMNGDGRKDVIALFSQGREGIYIFYQKDDLTFDVAHAIKMGSEYGSSWFELMDFNKDGLLDVVLVNGDNADYSQFLKPYHGVRLFLNSEGNKFKEEWFYPLNGATRVIAEDFDQDDDIDFAVISFFADYENNSRERFVYLENEDTDHFTFKSHTTVEATLGRWIVMEKGDFDQDGDVDIVLGGFGGQAQNKETAALERNIFHLENTLNSSNL